MVRIYLVTNLINGKVYVGQTKNTLNIRRQGHIDAAKYNPKGYFHFALRRCGIESFTWKVIHTVTDPDVATELERFYIVEVYKSNNPKIGYNLAIDGWKNCGRVKGQMPWNLGKPHSEKTKERIRLALLGKKRGPMSDEAKLKHSLSMIGKFKGRKRSLEAIEKSRKSQIGKKRSEETKKKMSLAGKGRVHSEETKKHLSEIRKGKPKTREFKEKVSQTLQQQMLNMTKKERSEKFGSFKGRKHSEETKVKMRESYKRRCVLC